MKLDPDNEWCGLTERERKEQAIGLFCLGFGAGGMTCVAATLMWVHYLYG